MKALGNIAVPSLCFGTSGLGNIGGAVSDEGATATIDQVIKASDVNSDGGGTGNGSGAVAYIETSPAYGLGLAEHRVGRALSHHSRERFILQTKVG